MSGSGNWSYRGFFVDGGVAFTVVALSTLERVTQMRLNYDGMRQGTTRQPSARGPIRARPARAAADGPGGPDAAAWRSPASPDSVGRRRCPGSYAGAAASPVEHRQQSPGRRPIPRRSQPSGAGAQQTYRARFGRARPAARRRRCSRPARRAQGGPAAWILQGETMPAMARCAWRWYARLCDAT